MCREGYYLDGVSNPLSRWEAGWPFVSVFYLSLHVIILTCHSKCSGETPDGQDFETFIGAEKANEMKQLFSNWIHTIYRGSSRVV